MEEERVKARSLVGGLAAADLLDKTFDRCQLVLLNRCLSIAVIKRKAIPVVFVRRQDLGLVSNNIRSSGVTQATLSEDYTTYI